MARKYSNTFAETTLTGSINNSVTTISIGSTTGLPASFPYTLAIDYGTSSVEMVTVTALAGANLTVTRGQDGTSAQSHTAGARVVHPVTARDLSEPQVHIDATSDIHGLSGGASVVGTSQAQTLTNKTISGSTNTLTNIPNTALVAIDASKVTQPFATLTTTGANGGAQVITVTGDEVGRNKPIATWIRTGSGGLVVGEDAVVQVTSGGFVVDPTQRPTGSASATARVVVKAQGKTGIRVDQNTAETNDFIVFKDPSGTTKYRVDSTGAVTASGGVTSSTSVTTATLAASGNATVGGTLGVTGALTASGGASVTGGVTATGTVQGATVTSTGAVNGASASITGAVAAASAAITGAVTTGSAGVSVAGETWHAMTLLNSWVNFGSGYANAQYRKIAGPGNSVEIIGTVASGTANTILATLPAGYRPASNIRQLIYAFGASMNISTETPAITVDTSGNITLLGTTNAGILAFHCIIPLDA